MQSFCPSTRNSGMTTVLQISKNKLMVKITITTIFFLQVRVISKLNFLIKPYTFYFYFRKKKPTKYRSNWKLFILIIQYKTHYHYKKNVKQRKFIFFRMSECYTLLAYSILQFLKSLTNIWHDSLSLIDHTKKIKGIFTSKHYIVTYILGSFKSLLV